MAHNDCVWLVIMVLAGTTSVESARALQTATTTALQTVRGAVPISKLSLGHAPMECGIGMATATAQTCALLAPGTFQATVSTTARRARPASMTTTIMLALRAMSAQQDSILLDG